MDGTAKDVIRRKMYICVAVLAGIGLIAAALLCFFGISSLARTPDLRRLRMDASRLAATIESGETVLSDARTAFAVVGNDGAVIVNSGTSLSSTVNLHSLSGADGETTGGRADGSGFFTMPLVRGGVQFATLYMEIDASYLGDPAVEAACAAVCALICAALGATVAAFIRMARRDVFMPIAELHSSTLDMLNGSLDTPVRYDYDGEIGTLCHDFELMRTELRDSVKNEQKLKDDERLLMASISHDLKTPLATVQGYLESITIGVVSGEAEVRAYCENALEKTVLLGRITDDILEHFKSELKQLTISPEEVYTAEYFGALTATLAADAKSRGFTLTAGEIPNLIIPLDKTRIAQVLENVVGNSYKYGKKNGTIEIRFREDGKRFFVAIKDDGAGIAAEDLPFVFDRFFRGDRARTQSVPGSGLGLAISKYIIEGHGGLIECDSILGVGTQIEFSLPTDL